MSTILVDERQIQRHVVKTNFSISRHSGEQVFLDYNHNNSPPSQRMTFLNRKRGKVRIGIFRLHLSPTSVHNLRIFLSKLSFVYYSCTATNVKIDSLTDRHLYRYWTRIIESNHVSPIKHFIPPSNMRRCSLFRAIFILLKISGNGSEYHYPSTASDQYSTPRLVAYLSPLV